MSNPAAKRPLIQRHVLAGIVCGLAGIVLFHFFGNATRGYIASSSLFYWWGFQWMNPGSETEHGWLILALSGWLWWRNLSRTDHGTRIPDTPFPETGYAVESRRRQPSAGFSSPRLLALSTPLAAMVGGLALHAVGFAAQQTRISIVAFLIFTWGVVRLAGGRRWGDAALFPLGFMLFALPISVLDEIGLPLRLWVTTAGERIAQLVGIEVVRSGTQLVAPDGRFNYDVAAPCSGVRSLMALTALSVLVGYLNFQSWWRRALVLGLCLPLVYLGNVARIVAIIFAAHLGGPEWGDRAHQVMGYGVFVIVLGGVLLGVALIHRWWPEREREQAKGGRAETPAPDSNARQGETTSYPRGVLGIATGIVVLAVVEMGLLHRLANLPPRGQVGVMLAADGLNPVELPAFLGTEWIGQRAEVSAVEREILPADTGFSRKNYAFVADRKQDVFLSVVLSGRDRTSIHRPELCLVGQGWTIAGAAQQTFRFPQREAETNADFRATVLQVRREVPSPRGKIVVPHLVAYWFVGGDTVVASHWQRFMRDAWNRVRHARADRWAYVLMQTDARDGEAAAMARMQTVLKGALPAFQRPMAGSSLGLD